jgi:hypothetical protein
MKLETPQLPLQFANRSILGSPYAIPFSQNAYLSTLKCLTMKTNTWVSFDMSYASGIFRYLLLRDYHTAPLECLSPRTGRSLITGIPHSTRCALDAPLTPDRWVVGKRPVCPARQRTRGLGRPWTLALTLTMPRTHGI